MNKDVILITAQPINEYFIWQNHLYIESCIEQGFKEEQIHILLYHPPGRVFNKNWNKLKEYYSNINIFVYQDKGIASNLSVYIPVLRPHILWQHFEALPELENKTIIYTDCDILWTNKLNIKHLLSDDVNYVSNASSYLNWDYFNNKYKDVLEHKKEEAYKRNFIEEICNIVGISESIVLENNLNTGGVQYILKNISSKFWKKVEKDVITIRKHLLNVNKEFFESENKGIQSWCADLWAVQFNLWLLEKETKVTKELDFAWATDDISKLKNTGILHNAGIASEVQNGINVFYKGKYHNGLNPFKDEHLEIIINDKLSQNLCTWYYTNKLLELKNKYKL